MLLSFTLSIPSNNAWNGRWTGENRLNVIVKNLGTTKKAIEKGKRLVDHNYFTYDFGDGWRARIMVEEIDSKIAVKLRKKSDGFCGYDWMVQSILDNEEIKIKEK